VASDPRTEGEYKGEAVQVLRAEDLKYDF